MHVNHGHAGRASQPQGQVCGIGMPSNVAYVPILTSIVALLPKARGVQMEHCSARHPLFTDDALTP